MANSRFKSAWVAGLVAAVALPQPVQAQTGCPEDAMIVFDGSGSMSEMGFNRLELPRIFEARTAMQQAIPPIAAERRLGLVVYGPGQSATCGNVDVRFAPVAGAGSVILDMIEALEPDGETALTEAVARAASVLGARGGIVVLITDGDETCGGTPCALAERLVVEYPALQVHVIGFRVRDAHFNWEDQGDDAYVGRDSKARCLADRTGGGYFATESVDDLVTALRQTLGCQVISSLSPDMAENPTARK